MQRLGWKLRVFPHRTLVMVSEAFYNIIFSSNNGIQTAEHCGKVLGDGRSGINHHQALSRRQKGGNNEVPVRETACVSSGEAELQTGRDALMRFLLRYRDLEPAAVWSDSHFSGKETPRSRDGWRVKAPQKHHHFPSASFLCSSSKRRRSVSAEVLIRHAAANVLRECWLLHRSTQSKDTSGEHRHHQRCLLEAIRV
ncbi:hypothetical protein DNTS_021630 [Danionella cerebrum]|nr:hypothetical protein DNTS_021630 [Danionella translucida]